MANQFTFKDNNPTGRYRSFERMSVDIKFKKKVCGAIHEISFDEWKINLMIKDGPNFKWVTLKHRPKTKVEAKEWLKENTSRILEQFDMYFQEQ